MEPDKLESTLPYFTLRYNYICNYLDPFLGDTRHCVDS